MFGKGDPANTLKRFRATLKMRQGESFACAILAPAHHPLRQSLNDDGPFVEIETEEGRQAFNEKRPPDFTGALRRRGEAWGEPSAEDRRRLDEAYRSGEF